MQLEFLHLLVTFLDWRDALVCTSSPLHPYRSSRIVWQLEVCEVILLPAQSWLPIS